MAPAPESFSPALSRRGLLTTVGAAGLLSGTTGGLWVPPGYAAPYLTAGEVVGTAERNPKGPRWVKKRFPGDPGIGRVYYGSVISTATTIRRFENSLAHPLGSHRNFHQAGQVRQLIRRARQDVAARRFSVLSIKPPGSWKSVAQGAHNAWLDEILEGLAEIDAPMAFTINHEPENNVNGRGNTPEWHKRMTEFVFARAADRAPKVHVIQILMQFTFKSGNGRNPADWLAPSVRLFGMDAYNYWTPGGSVRWISFKRMVSRAQEWADGKPVVIGEYGVHTDPARPGRAARWMKRALTYASQHDVIAMNYFNTPPAGNTPSFELRGERLTQFKRSLRDTRTVRLKRKRQ
ncbi:MAG: hypothetical protein ACRCYU_20945 [Nocardioides sp.]